jgi:hypothetical protein
MPLRTCWLSSDSGTLPVVTDAPTPAVTAVETFIDVWAGEVRRRVPEVQQLRDRYERMDRAVAHADAPMLSEEDVYEAWQQLWAAQHHLVWAAYQLERWVARLARETHQQAPAADPVLADLRHALEHLDEAEFDEQGATPGARSRSLRALPGGRLDIGPGTTRRMFDLVDDADLERRALAITTTSDRLMVEAEAFVDWLRSNGEWPAAEEGEES